MAVRILLVDGHSLFRGGLAALLATRDDLDVIGEASNGEEALEVARELAPDLVLMDLAMPVLGGLETTRRLKAEHPAMRVIVLTVSEEDEDLFEAIKAGAQGYLLKNLTAAEALDLIAKAAAGDAAFTPTMASRALDLWATGRTGDPDRLTPREREVLEKMVDGAGNAAIAAALGLSESTVRFHLRNILSKLHARSRTEAAVRALRRGLLGRST